MELTEEQLQKLLQKLKVGKCPNCGCQKEKIVTPDIYQLVSFDFSQLVPGEKIPYQPLVAARCPQCAYTMLFNLKDLGIVE